VVHESITLEDKIALLRETLRREECFLFRDFFARSPSRLHLVVTFMAMLELVRLGEASIHQEGFFAEIWIRAARPSATAPPAAHAASA
jgi:segregation and condensation protein A